MQESKAAEPYPSRVVLHPLERNDELWRPYMAPHRQDHPHQYHNGGMWPFVGGFWVMVLARLGRSDAAWQALQRLAAVNALDDQRFTEWLHGRKLAPMGIAGQSWSAATFQTRPRSTATGDHHGRRNTFNISIRKFLKMVGVKSQHEIEQAVARMRADGSIAGTDSFVATMTLDVAGLQLNVRFDGEIRLQQRASLAHEGERLRLRGGGALRGERTAHVVVVGQRRDVLGAIAGVVGPIEMHVRAALRAARDEQPARAPGLDRVGARAGDPALLLVQAQAESAAGRLIRRLPVAFDAADRAAATGAERRGKHPNSQTHDVVSSAVQTNGP